MVHRGEVVSDNTTHWGLAMRRSKSLTAGPILAFFGLLPLGAWAQQTQGDYYHGRHMWDGDWMFFGPLMMIAFVAVIVVVVVLLVRGLGGHHATSPASSDSNALDILKERFARGEIDKEDYEERKRILRGR